MPTDIPPLPPLEQVRTPDAEELETSLGIQESGGDYGAINPDAYGPDNPALGKYQTLWTTATEVLERHRRVLPRTHQEYLDDHRKQEEVMDLLMQEAIQQATDDTPDGDLETIIRKAAAIHYGGPGNMSLYNDTNPQEGGYPSFREYGDKVWTRYNAGTRGY